MAKRRSSKRKSAVGAQRRADPISLESPAAHARHIQDILTEGARRHALDQAVVSLSGSSLHDIVPGNRAAIIVAAAGAFFTFLNGAQPATSAPAAPSSPSTAETPDQA